MEDQYYDDNYDDEYYDYDDNEKNNDPYQFYFKFDVGATPLSDWIQKMINDVLGNPTIINIPDFPVMKFPVSSWNPNAAKDLSFQYLGSNTHGEPVWKMKYFINNKLNQSYTNHLVQHAKYFVEQPAYYRGMFDILN